MALTLPGLFDFTQGVSSAIAQQNARATTSSNEALSFVNQLNAFNQSLNTNDNLQFRQDFADQPQGTSILDRFQAIAQESSNPFNVSQAAVQQQSLAPLLALNAVQNPLFAQQQGLPNTPQSALSQGFLGFNPIFQQAANQNIQATLAANNAPLQATAVGNQFGQAAQQAVDNSRLQLELQQQRQQRDLIKDLQDQIKQLSQNQRANTPATPGNTARAVTPPANVSSLPTTRGG